MKRNPATANKRDNRNRGAVAAEFAIAASLLVMMFFGVLEVGMLLRTRTTVTDVSR